MVRKEKLEHVICVWQARKRNHHAGALALQALDGCWADHIAHNTALSLELPRWFNDRLLDKLLEALKE